MFDYTVENFRSDDARCEHNWKKIFFLKIHRFTQTLFEIAVVPAITPQPTNNAPGAEGDVPPAAAVPTTKPLMLLTKLEGYGDKGYVDSALNYSSKQPPSSSGRADRHQAS